MRGILSAAAYVPHWRLDRATIAPTIGTGGGKGTRSVASFDEDTTTMGVEAARSTLRRALASISPAAITFSTVSPAYLDKTNATAIHAALRLDSEVIATDALGAVRSGAGALRTALAIDEPALVVLADTRGGLPGSGDESSGGDGAAALLVGSDADGPVLAEHLAHGGVTDEFVDRWRTPGDSRSKLWEEKFGETAYVPLAEQAWNQALKRADLSPDQVDRVAVAGLHARAVASTRKRLRVDDRTVDDLSTTVGNTGAAHPGVLLTSLLETAEPGQVLALIVLADGADVFLFRATDEVARWAPGATVAEAATAGVGAVLPYGKFLAWRGMLSIEPPRRPEPQRVSSSAAARSEAWKFAFVGSRDSDTGFVSLPPAAAGNLEPVPMADVGGTIVTFTVDRLAYSPSPPVVFAVVDFDGGGRLPVELCDCDPSEVQIGGRVAMTFRRLFTADGIHNYFWKARLVRAAGVRG